MWIKVSCREKKKPRWPFFVVKCGFQTHIINIKSFSKSRLWPIDWSNHSTCCVESVKNRSSNHQNGENVGFGWFAQKHQWLQNHTHLWTVWIRTQDQKQIQGEARPLGHETFQREDWQDISTLQTLHVSCCFVWVHWQRQAGTVEALHGQTWHFGAVSQGSIVREGHQLCPRRFSQKEKLHRQ